MQSDKRERAVVCADFDLSRLGKMMDQRVDHDIAYIADSRFVHALSPKIDFTRGFAHKQQIRDSVCRDPIDFFRHAAIERTKSGFQMNDGDVEFRCRERRGEC